MLTISRSDSSLLAIALYLKKPFQIGAKSNMNIDKVNALSLPQTISKHLAQTSKPEILGRDNSEYAQIHDWVSTCNETTLSQLDDELKSKTFLVGNRFTLADIYHYAKIYQFRGIALSGNLKNVVRYFDLIQSILINDLQEYFKKVTINLDASMPVAAIKSQKGNETEKSVKKVDRPAVKKSNEKPEEKKAVKASTMSPARLDLRVGKIVDVSHHPDADSLYIEKIDLGEASGPRQIVSGLVKYMTLSDLHDRLVICICNLKPSKIRGIDSAGMVFCAERDGFCEPIAPPASSKPGDKVWFEGVPEATPDAILKSKEKVWESIQPKFKVTVGLQGSFFDGKEFLLVTKEGPCIVKNAALVGANMK